MAEDWLKILKNTPNKPEVLAIAARLGISPAESFLQCFRFWSWCDSEIADGDLPTGISLAMFDSHFGHPDGFAQALREEGWLIMRTGPDGRTHLSIPNYHRHLGHSAKKRAQEASRQRRCRDRSGGSGQPSRKESRIERDKNMAPSNSLSPSLEELNSAEKENAQKARKNRAADFPNGSTPAGRLAAQWLFSKGRVPCTAHDHEAASYMQDLLTAGVSEEAIAAAIDGRTRKTEPVWEFQKRLMPKAAPDLLDGIRQFAMGGGQ